MLVKNWKYITICFVFILLAAITNNVCAQEQFSTDLWNLIPSNSLLVVGFDGRPGNNSMQALAKVEEAEAKELRMKQQIALRKAVEDFALLFGVSLDFAKDIDSWADMQWAFAIVPECENNIQPVFMMASKDPAAANSAMQKMMEPWQRIGELSTEQDTDYSIISFKEKSSGIKVYASAFGQVIAISPSKDSLKQALHGTGFSVGSAGDKAFKALTGSMCYMFIDPILVSKMNIKGYDDIPMSGLGIGMSAYEKGVKMQILGYPNEQVAMAIKGMLPITQKNALVANPGVPSNSLVASSMLNLSPVLPALAAGFMPGTSIIPENSIAGLKAVCSMQISAGVTALLPMPSGVISAMAESDEAATENMAAIIQMQKPFRPAIKINGIEAIVFGESNGKPMYLAKVGKYILLATDTQSLSAAAATVNSEKPSLAQLATYNEVINGLSNSNFLTVYMNLAPIQGVGFLIEGMGLGQYDRIYSLMAKELQNVQAMGVGLGCDGEAFSAEIFVRAKPGMSVAAGPILMSTASLGAVLFPVFEQAREKARQTACISNLKQLGLGTLTYSQDYDGKIPTRDNWQSQIYPYIKNDKLWVCPGGKTAYAFNKNLGGLNLNKIRNPEDVILFFEASLNLPNASGSRANVILPHNGIGNFVYADGHVRALNYVPDQSHWVPKYETAKPAPKIPVKKYTIKKPSAKTNHHR